VNADYWAAMVHYVLHARPNAELDQVIAEHPGQAEANARLDRLYVWEERGWGNSTGPNQAPGHLWSLLPPFPRVLPRWAIRAGRTVIAHPTIRQAEWS
jgi:hypothetical protein